MDEPTCAYCGRKANEIPGLEWEAEQEDMSAAEYAREDGTYNPETDHFACDGCYIKIGMPSSPEGWIAP